MSSMAISPIITLFFSMFLVLQSTINAFNITEILSQFKQFGGYNSLLIDTGVAKQINSLVAATVLVVSDDQLFYFNNLQKDVITKILRFHVILDYYDESKLESLKSRTNLATLSQEATMIVDHDSSGSVTFKSNGSSNTVKLLSTINSQPPSISVLQLASIVLMNGVFDSSSALSSSTSPEQSPSTTGSIAPPPRKVLVPPMTSRDTNSPTPNAPPPSKTKPSNATPPNKSLGLNSSDDGSPVPWPLKPSSAPAAADVLAPSFYQNSSAHARMCYENYLGSIVMVFNALWLIFIMN